MTSRYRECYLDDVMENLGEMTDFAVNSCRLAPDQYWNLFLSSGLAGEIEGGSPYCLCGLSGTELVFEVFARTGYRCPVNNPPDQTEYEYSPEYWSGWITAYYQWKSGRTFPEICRALPISEVIRMYPLYHEMAEDQFADAAEDLLRRKSPKTKLAQMRRLRGYSQRLLAARAGINLRTLQQYETRAKDINKAAAQSLYALADALGCQMIDLMERPQMERMGRSSVY